MANISFDDLIPAQRAAAPPQGKPLSFDDLIPAQKRQAVADAAQRLATLPDRRINQSFEDAATGPDVRLSQDDPRAYGFTDKMLSSLPFGDEVGAFGGAIGRYAAGKTGQAPEMSMADAWQFARAMEKRFAEEYATENPGKSAAATGVGIAAFGAPRAALQAGARGMPAALGIPTTLKGQVAQGVTQGAIAGGVYGAGEGEGLGDRAYNAAKGGVVGGAIGAAIPGAVAGVGGLTKRVFSPVSTSAANRLRPQGRATGLVEEAFRRDGIPMNQAAQRLDATRRVNPDAVLADIGGENVRGITRAAVNMPGQGREAVKSLLAARNLAQPQRVVDAVTSVLKDPKTFGQTTARLAAERQKIAAPIYEQAFKNAKPVNVSGVVKYIDDQVRPGVNQVASPLADLRPDGITATLSRLRSFFATQTSQRVDLRQLHQVKMEMDDMIGAAKRAGDNNKARAVLGVKNRLMKAMSPKGSLYDRARSIYSSSHEMDDALEVGRNVFNATPDEVRAAINGMSAAEKEMVQVGTARAIADRVSGMRDGRDVVKTIFGTPKIRDTLRAAFQDDQAFRKFQATLMRESTMRRTGDAVFGNSTTAQQVGDMIGLQGGAAGRDVLNHLLEGRILPAAAAGIRQAVMGERGLSEAVANRISDMLISNDPQKIAAAIQQLSQRQGAVDRLAQRLGAVQQLTTRELAGGSAKALAN